MSLAVREQRFLTPWVPAPASSADEHALRQFLNLTGLTPALTHAPPDGTAPDGVLAVALGPLEEPAASHLRSHIGLGGPALLDADAALALKLPGVEFATALTPGSFDAAPAGTLRLPGMPVCAIWAPVLSVPGEAAVPGVAEMSPAGTTFPAALAPEQGGSVIVLPFPVGAPAMWLLGGRFEDRFGPWPLISSPYETPPQWAEQPALDIYARLVWTAACEAARRAGRSIAGTGRLPAGSSAVAVLSHDLDSLKKNARALAADTAASLRNLRLAQAIVGAAALLPVSAARIAAKTGLVRENDPHRFVPAWLMNVARRAGVEMDYLASIDRLVEVERRRGASATFFFLANPTAADGDTRLDAPLTATTLRGVQSRGSEAGLHGSVPSNDDTGVMKAEAEALRTASGAPVTSIRQHHLHLSRKTIGKMSGCGFLVDSSAGYNFAPAFKTGTAAPFELPEREGDDAPLLELPLAIMDTALALSPSPAQAVAELVRRLAEASGFVSINWHPHFRMGAPGSEQTYTVALDALPPGAEFVTVSRLGLWWAARSSIRVLSMTQCGGQDGSLWATVECVLPVSRVAIITGGVGGDRVYQIPDLGPGRHEVELR